MVAVHSSRLMGGNHSSSIPGVDIISVMLVPTNFLSPSLCPHDITLVRKKECLTSMQQQPPAELNFLPEACQYWRKPFFIFAHKDRWTMYFLFVVKNLICFLLSVVFTSSFMAGGANDETSYWGHILQKSAPPARHQPVLEIQTIQMEASCILGAGARWQKSNLKRGVGMEKCRDERERE